MHTEFLAANAPGLHHVCFETDDVGAACARAEAAGHTVAMRGSMMDGEIDFAYLDCATAGAPYVELARIGPVMREFYDAVKAGAYPPSPPKCGQIARRDVTPGGAISRTSAGISRTSAGWGRASRLALRDAGTKVSTCALMLSPPTTQKEIGR